MAVVYIAFYLELNHFVSVNTLFIVGAEGTFFRELQSAVGLDFSGMQLS